MNNAIELLMLLVFFIPIAAMVLLNLATYRVGYVAQPQAPARAARTPAAAAPAIVEEYDFDFREAA